MKRLKPRPICPQCGSADVVVGDKTGVCNRCGEMFRATAATDYPIGAVGEWRSSVDDIEARSRDDDDWIASEYRRAMSR